MYTRSEVMVSNSLQHMNDDVILLGSALHKGTTKFSAKGDDKYSVVNLTFSMASAVWNVQMECVWQ